MNDLVLVLIVAGQRSALRTAAVHSVVELDVVASVPQAPPFVLGLSALRSITLTVIDTAAALGLRSPVCPEPGARVAVVDHAGHRYALVVDEVEDVAELLAAPAPVPGEVGEGWHRASEGLVETTRGPALLLSLEALIAGPAALAA
ncbi:chemotaxis protein CheW [Tsuneonella sp. HG249]